MWVALRTMKLQGKMVPPGTPLPGADRWKSIADLERTGLVARADTSDLEDEIEELTADLLAARKEIAALKNEVLKLKKGK